jgi:uncharacterized SAM-dependent methyltransferase
VAEPRRSSIPPMAFDEVGELARDVRVSLLRQPRSLPMKWMFDDVGSALFDAWSHLPESGMTRAEGRVLERNVDRIADALAPTSTAIEIGPATGRRKAALLAKIARRQPLAYTLVDRSDAMRRRALADLGGIANLAADGVRGPINDAIRAALSRRGPGAALILWLGHGIGVYDPSAAESALARIRAMLAPGDAVLLGTDMIKHEAVMLRAYDDTAGVAAAFNRTYLARVDRELGGDLDVRAFRHEARWNGSLRRIELHLVATQPVHARITAAGITIRMDAGESICTVTAYKMQAHEPGLLGTRTGFAAAGQWLDPTWPYAVTLLVAQ